MNDNLPAKGELLVYQTEDGNVKLDVRLENETVWLTQQLMADLFQTTKQNIGQHLKNIFSQGELDEVSVVKKFFATAGDGKKYKTNFYNLDAIISVGYRVKSLTATRFRMWATERLKEYIVKGFTMDDDYDPSWSETTKFFSVIQNKLHYAATSLAAAELIQSRADHTVSNMGLTSWKAGDVRKTDVTVAKNYLKEVEIDGLNRIVVMWLDFAEDQARRRKQVFMKDWEQKLDEFLKFNERRVLPHAGSVGKKDADEHARLEYDKFALRRREYKEGVGEAESIKALEAAAMQLGKPGKGESE